MPDRDPNILAIFGAAFDAIQVFIYAAMVAIVRILMDEREKIWHRVLLEMVFCGLLAQGADELVRVIFSWDMPTAVAAGVGLLGPTYIRMKLRKVIEKKIEGETE